MQVLLAVNHFFIFAAVTLTRLEEARLLYPPRQETSKTVRQSVACHLYGREYRDGKRWRKEETLRTSFPRGIPLPRAQVRPMTLATNVLNVRYSFRTTPLSIVFISGIPEPGTNEEERDARWDDGEERKGAMKESNYGERDEGRERRGEADWYSYSFMYAHLISGYIVRISCSRDH